ncbi:DNA polymerase/3'-5' exonuclease PolX [Geomicrobium sp. JCM 19038]|uniref:DNA polymerase/3'-5' exonuclease PolX n=1 Tax=Geomicrobium sp. JCM 19038 TaxID=1460635 RepID=UPI00045F3716|nr:DNA polymerase/3'-5' exonuclease PolX [Geomicrobium sp. JCM 19038]GAK09730.1 DNA polymerase X family [Geomicrobium sp. JCM 19038]
MDKKAVIKTLETIAVYMEIAGENPFKTSAYRKAAQALEREERTLDEIEKPENLTGIGKGTASVITELKETGETAVLNDLKERVPADLPSLLQLPSLGGKKINKLYKELGITDVDTLKLACEQGQVQALAGFGKKSEEKILAALEEVGKRPDRLPVAFMLDVADQVEEELCSFTGITRFERAGSLRRVKETIRDADYVISTTEPDVVREQLRSLRDTFEVIADGDTKVSLTLEKEYRVNVDFRLVNDEEFATALHHFTGSKDHHLLMRKRAKDLGQKINEYGVEDLNEEKLHQFETEEQFFHHFDLHYIPPEAREGTIELDWFKEDRPLIEERDIVSDLHMHTVWSDGANSIKEMALAARDQGYGYIVITDHSKYLQVANGLTEERLLRQIEEIKAVNEEVDGIHIFAGTEMDIKPDGTLDFDDEILSQLDFVIASIHSSFQQSQETLHERLDSALNNPYVHLIAHPTGRIIGQRPGYDVDVDWLIERASETNTALELNANPNRLDLTADSLRKARDKGVRVAVNTDAHRKEMLNHMSVGVSTCKKAFLTREDVINTYSLEQFKQYIGEKRRRFQ